MTMIEERQVSVSGGLEKVEAVCNQLLTLNPNAPINPRFLVLMREQLRQGVEEIKIARERARLKKEKG